MPHGHFGALGPGLVSLSKAFASSYMKMYLLTGLHLFTFKCEATMPRVWCCGFAVLVTSVNYLAHSVG